MNVPLAEAKVPYPQLMDLEETNPQFPRTDVTNAATRRRGNAVSGMPILDVAQVRSVIVVERSRGRGHAGIDNELYPDPETAMPFSDNQAGRRDTRTAGVRRL